LTCYGAFAPWIITIDKVITIVVKTVLAFGGTVFQAVDCGDFFDRHLVLVHFKIIFRTGQAGLQKTGCNYSRPDEGSHPPSSFHLSLPIFFYSSLDSINPGFPRRIY